MIEGAAQTYAADDPTGAMPAAVSNLVPTYIKDTPGCPAGGPAYSINGSGTVAACTGGTPAHGLTSRDDSSGQPLREISKKTLKCDVGLPIHRLSGWGQKASTVPRKGRGGARS